MRKNLYILLSSVIALLFSLSGYAAPLFTAGHTQSLTVCQNSSAKPVNSLLIVADATTGSTDTWSLGMAATHGTAVTSYSATSTGGPLTPTGTTYTPTAGYVGNDSFKVYVSDGTNKDSTMVYVSVVVAPAPITGPSTVCQGYIITMTDASLGGTWSTSNTSVITATAGGLVTGMSGGSANVIYTISSGCAATKAIAVFPTAPITGTPVMCPGDAVILANAISGGTWSSSNTVVATVSGGTVMGMSAGTAYITYTYTTGCISFVMATVNPTPAPISGVPMVCISGTTTLSDASSGGTWTSDNTAIATIDTFTGFISGVAVGPANITYAFPATGCYVSVPFTVNSLPDQYTITGGGNYCSADSGTHVYLSTSHAAVSYFLHTGSTTFGPFAGTGAMLDFGWQKIAGTYTAFATNTATGCSNIMLSSVSVSITPSVPVSINITSGVGDSICNGTNVAFNANPVNSGTVPVYQWQVNGIDVGTNAPTYTYVPGAGDVVSAMLAADTLCALPDTVIDTYNVMIITPTAPSVSVSAYPSVYICKGSPVTIKPAPYLGGTAPTYIYYVGGVPVGTGSKLPYVPNDSDVITCMMISNYFCRSVDSVYTSIQIYVPPVEIPFFDINAYPSVMTAPGQTITFTAIVTNSSIPNTYQWSINNSIIPGATSDTFVTSSLTYMGNDSVSCDVHQAGACNLTTFNWRKMENNVFVKQVAKTGSSISALPNPANGNFTIRGTLASGANETVAVEVANMMGQIVYRKNITAINGSINEQVMLKNTIPNGIYMLNLRSATENKVFHLVIEQ